MLDLSSMSLNTEQNTFALFTKIENYFANSLIIKLDAFTESLRRQLNGFFTKSIVA